MFVRPRVALLALLCVLAGCGNDDAPKKQNNTPDNDDPGNVDPNVDPSNNAPTARDDEVTTEESIAVTIDVLANDSDPDGDMLSIAEVQPPPNGTAVISGDRISYTPNAAFAGIDEFGYTVSDGRGGVADAVVTVNVLGLPNDPPVAVDDMANTLAGSPITISVLANDSDPNGDPLTITSFTPPQLGTVELQGTVFNYTPPATEGGSDFFTYTIDDAHQSTAIGRVFVTVNGAPVANDDLVDMLVDTTIQFDPTSNDVEPEGEALTITAITAVSNGTATLIGNLVEYTPDAGFEGFDGFDYTVVDPNGLTATGNVTIEVVPPFRGFEMSAGSAHACRIQPTGSLACWGRGGDQLGLGTYVDARSPMQVGAATDWQSVTAGDSHTCGVRGNGTLWCWGSNTWDQLGLPGQNSTNAPLQVGTDTDWHSASAGNGHTCAIKSDGRLFCVGDNDSGQTGVSNSFSIDTFTQVGTDFGWVQVAAGYQHTCGIRGAGSLWCWGENRNGQLGQGADDDRGGYTALQVGTNPDWERVAAGYDYTCAIRSGALYCWGAGYRGQLGTGGTSDVVSPAQIGSETDWRHISAGDTHTCGVRSGQLWCWGDNTYGQLGNGTLASSFIPVRVGNAVDWDEVYVGREFSCGTRTSGELYCWGRHSDGQLAIGSLYDTTVPQRVGTATNWAYVEASAVATCAVDTTGQMHCFGSNRNGQLANNTTVDQQTPIVSLGGGDWAQLGHGPETLCGIKSNGALYCWGRNWLGMVGDGTDDDKLVPTRITSQTYVSVDGGDQHGCAVQTNGSMWCWGRNTRDQLGLDSTVVESLVPVQIGVDLNWDMVDAGDYGTCGLKAGSVFCWGDQLGGTPLMQGTAIDYTMVSMGGSEVCAIRADNTLWCWNAGSTPAQVGGDADWQFVAADGARHSCGIRMDDSLWCWGYNYTGEVGDGTTTNRGAPVQVGFDSDWTSVTTGGGVFNGHTCGTRANGELYCWGSNDLGQLGLGGVWFETPQLVQ